MTYNTKHTRGIFCIETVWYGDEDRTSCRPMLQLLEDLYEVPYICRDAVTKEELFFYLTTWKVNKNDYPILYLGFHGEEGKIWLKTADGCDCYAGYEVIGAQLEEACHGGLVHFASCSSMNLANVELDRFLGQTNASAVSGYTQDVDFGDSIALELTYFADLQYHYRRPLTPTVARTVKSNITTEPYKMLSDHLGFIMRCAGA